MELEVTIKEGEDGWFIVECPALPGCMSQGRTKEECLKNISEAIILWIEAQIEKRKRDAVTLLPSAHREIVKVQLAGAF